MTKKLKYPVKDIQLHVGDVICIHQHSLTLIGSRQQGKSKKIDLPEPLQNRKFALMSGFLKGLGPLFRETYAHLALSMPAFMKAYSDNVKTAISITTGEIKIDYASVKLSRGSLRQAKPQGVASILPGMLTFLWTSHKRASKKDHVFIAVYCEILKQWKFQIENGMRCEGMYTLDISAFSGQPVHCYLGFISQYGGNASDTLYLNEVNVL